MQKSFLTVALLLISAIIVAMVGCEPAQENTVPYNPNGNNNNNSGTDGTTDGDADGDTDTDVDADTDADADTDTDTDADGDSDFESSCESTPYEIKLQPVNMLILLDRSASMFQFEFEGTTFEKVIDDALKEVVQDPDNNLVNFGLAAFPSQQCKLENASSAEELCYPTSNVAVPISSGVGDAIAQKLDEMETCGGTPIAASLRWAKSYLESSLTEDLLSNPTYVLLATDGAPNCSSVLDVSTCLNTNPEQPLQQSEQCLDSKASANAALSLYAGQSGNGFLATAMDTKKEMTISVPTYVVGVGDLAEWDSVMNDIANAGGGKIMPDNTSSQYFQATDPASVTAAFKDIVAEATPCSFDIVWDEVPVKDSQKGCGLVKVFKTTDGVVPEEEEAKAAAELPFSADCSTLGGWHYAGQTGEVNDLDYKAGQCSKVELCPESCEDLKYGRLEGLSFQFGCRPVI